MKKVKLIIEIDKELLDYIRNEHYDKHLQQRFDYQSKWAIKNGKPLQTGHWISSPYDHIGDDCSVCGARWTLTKAYKHCPSCGAKMERS